MHVPAWLLRRYAAHLDARARRGDADPAAAQRETLARLMSTYRHTELGRLQGFDRVDSPEAFRRVVAVSTPETTRTLFEGVHDHNPPGAVVPGRLEYMAKCSGTSGVRKLVPYPKPLLKAFKAFEMAIAMRHMHETGHFDVLDGRLLVTTGTPALAPASNGLRLGYGTGIMTDLAPAIAKGKVLPSIPTRLIGDTLEKLAAIAHESWREDIRLLTGVPTWVIPEAEAVLAHAAAQGVPASCLSDLWPQLRGYVWSGCAIGPYAERLRGLIGPNVPFREVYAGTEGPMAFQWDLGADGLRLALELAYFEFQRPSDPIDAPRLGVAELVEGETYRLLITTSGGLGAYRIGDLLTCTSTRPLRLRFAGREFEEMSLATEQIVLTDLKAALDRALATSGATGAGTFVVMPGPGAKPSYAWYVEAESGEAGAIARAIDAELSVFSPFYASCRQGDAFIGPPRVRLLPPGTIQAAVEGARDFGLGKVCQVYRQRAQAAWLLEALGEPADTPITAQ